MKKVFIVLFALVMISGMGYAQGLSLSVGAGVNAPMGDFGDAADVGFGADARLQYQIGPMAQLYASLGYFMWGGVDITTSVGSVSTDYKNIPIMVGGKISTPAGIYGLIELGMNMFSWSGETTTTIFGTTTTVEYDDSEAKFGGGVGGGYCMPLSPSVTLDVSAKYNWVQDDLSNILGRVGVVVGL
jgi:hypothetical protein